MLFQGFNIGSGNGNGRIYKRQCQLITLGVALDFGNLFHLFYFPYCKLIILERHMCSILNQIKSHCKVLDGVEVRNVDFFSNNKILKR